MSNNERERAIKHIEAAAGSVQQLQPEVPSVAGSLGAGTDEWYGKTIYLTGEVSYIGEDRD